MESTPQTPRGRKRAVRVMTLPGEPVDGSGRVCIHLFIRDSERGSFTEPHVLSPALDENGGIIKGQLSAGPERGRLACDPKRVPSSRPDKQGVITVTQRTDDPRAVTCPRCMATVEYEQLIRQLNGG